MKSPFTPQRKKLKISASLTPSFYRLRPYIPIDGKNRPFRLPLNVTFLHTVLSEFSRVNPWLQGFAFSSLPLGKKRHFFA